MADLPSLLDSALKGWLRQGPPFIDFKPRKSSPQKYSDQNHTLNVASQATTSSFVQKDPDQAADLARLVEGEIIPRLMLAHSAKANADAPADLGLETTESFARMVLSKDSDSLIAHIGTLLQSGLDLETIYVDLMVPTARLLGDYWNEDTISFTDVTIGLSRLQQVVRTLGWRDSQSNGPDHSAPSALFVPATSGQHMFGLFIIEDSFRRAGWRTWIETAWDGNDLTDMVRTHWFDVLGISAGCDGQENDVTTAIAAVRKASRNRGIMILVGGRLFLDRPELVAVVGADATAATGGDALLIADKTVRRLASHV